MPWPLSDLDRWICIFPCNSLHVPTRSCRCCLARRSTSSPPRIVLFTRTGCNISPVSAARTLMVISSSSSVLLQSSAAIFRLFALPASSSKSLRPSAETCIPANLLGMALGQVTPGDPCDWLGAGGCCVGGCFACGVTGSFGSQADGLEAGSCPSVAVFRFFALPTSSSANLFFTSLRPSAETCIPANLLGMALGLGTAEDPASPSP